MVARNGSGPHTQTNSRAVAKQFESGTTILCMVVTAINYPSSVVTSLHCDVNVPKLTFLGTNAQPPYEGKKSPKMFFYSMFHSYLFIVSDSQWTLYLMDAHQFQIVLRYDIILFMEISDSTETMIYSFLDGLNGSAN